LTNTEETIMRTVFVLLLIVLIGLQGCAYLQPKKAEVKPEGFGKSRATDLMIAPAQDTVVAEWGATTETAVEVTWAAEQKFSVELAPAAGTPNWLGVELQPLIVDPPGRIAVRITPVLGEARLGATELKLEGSAYNIGRPVEAKIVVMVRRQAGDFVPLLAARQTLECRNICGKVDRAGRLVFYDVLREKDQTCSETAALPENQRIGSNTFQLTERGFGYGRTCRVAGVYDALGNLSFVNLGISSALPRGAMLLSLRAPANCWLSPDNTVALIEASGMALPWDVLTGAALSQPCRISGSLSSPVLSGTTIASGSCTWEIQ
jgi:hypothetical protein